MKQKIILLLLIVCMAIPCFAGSPFNIWTKPDADWLTGQTPNFDPAWAWMKWMDGMVSPPGDVFYVDGVNGLATNDGLSWNRAKKTITQGLALMTKNHSTLFVGGTAYSEACLTPIGVARGRIIGVCNANQIPFWESGGAGATHLRIRSGEWEVANFRFQSSVATVAHVTITKSGGSSIIRDCWFSGNGSESGIEAVGAAFDPAALDGAATDIKIFRNRFSGFTTAGGLEGAICGTDYGDSAAVVWEIIGNTFADNTKNINLRALSCRIQGNTFTTSNTAAAATLIISTRAGGDAGGGNAVVGNYFPHTSADVTVTNGYEFSSTDNVVGNYCLDGAYPKTGIEGDEWYVDNLLGNAANSGRSWGQALTLIQDAVDLADDFDTIYIKGGIYTTYAESVTMTQDVPGLKFIGVGDGPMTPGWHAAVVGEHALSIISSNVEVRNIRFWGASKEVAFIEVETQTASRGDASIIENCYFDGGNTSHSAVEYSGGSLRNEFLNNTVVRFGMANTAYEAAVWTSHLVQTGHEYRIIGNYFADNVDHLSIQSINGIIKDNVFQADGTERDATIILDVLQAGSQGGNVVTGNVFGDLSFEINNANGYYGSSTDNWAGNICPDGLTKGIPYYPRYFAVSADLSTGSGWETAAAHEIAEVTGTVRVKILCEVTETVTDAAGACDASLGVATNTAELIAVGAIGDGGGNDQLIVGEIWTAATTDGLGTLLVTGAAGSAFIDAVIVGGLDLGYTISGAAATNGTIIFHIWWEPLDATGLVTPGDGTGF